MNSKLKLYALRARWYLKQFFNSVVGWFAVTGLRAWRLTDRKRSANFAGWFMRKAGPWLSEHRVGRANLAAAFPEKTPAEIEQILADVWDNVGRVGAEFAHLDRLRLDDSDGQGPADISFDDATSAHFLEVRDGDRPTLTFAAHLANWELPALCGAHFKLDACVLFRPPNIRAVSDAVMEIRSGIMGTLIRSSLAAPTRLAREVESGRHAGMLVDQHDRKGVDVIFFGRRCKVTPLLGQLAHRFDCPIRGARIIRQPDRHSFRAELTAPLDLPRDAEGRIDVERTMQAITSVVESWVREYPGQWLWLHRRWR
ncbi:MAG: lipid A biosynthesis lauroyl acyltransferase [Xanthobacteraceae bacterium]